MSETSGSRSGPSLVVGAIAVAVVLVGGYFASGMLFGGGVERDLVSGDPQRMVVALAQIDNAEFTSEANVDLRGRSLAALKDASIEDLFDRMRSAELSDADRDNLDTNMRDLMMEDMNNKIDEYTEAPKEAQDAILDRHIDEMQDFWGKMKAYHEKNKDDPDYQADRERREAKHRRPSKQDRKNWMEGVSPDRMVRMFKYWGSLKARADARGIDFGRGRDD